MGKSLPEEAIDRDANGDISFIELAFENAGSQKARGADFSISYQIETRFGTLSWLTQATYLDSFQFAELPTAPELELRSGIRPEANADEGYLKWRANSQIGWAWKGFELGLTAHYLDGFHEILNKTEFTGVPYPNNIKEHYVKQTWFFDVRGSYRFHFGEQAAQPAAGYSKNASTSESESRESAPAQTVNYGLPPWQHLLNGTTVTIGCNDVFGQDPPHASALANYADFLYDFDWPLRLRQPDEKVLADC